MLLDGITASYGYDTANAVQEIQGSTVNPILTGLGIDERFARNKGATRTDFLADAGGTLIQQYQYDPYGKTTRQRTRAPTRTYQYTGRENDGDGLYYYRARYYNPAMGRFISEDPLGFAGGQNNFYAYGHESPMIYVDRNGKDPVLMIVGFVGGGAWGFLDGYFSGDRGSQLFIDAGEGAFVGGLAGMTDGLILLEGSAFRIGAGYAIRAGLSMGGEMGRQEINYGCVTNWGEVAVAGGASLLGSGVGSFGENMVGRELRGFDRVLGSASSETAEGMMETAISQQLHQYEQREQMNANWTRFQQGLH